MVIVNPLVPGAKKLWNKISGSMTCPIGTNKTYGDVLNA